MTGDPWNWPTLTTGYASGSGAGLKIARQDGSGAGGDGKSGALSAFLDGVIDRIAPCPWYETSRAPAAPRETASNHRIPLYTPEERLRRDSTRWTLVQGILAPIQFAVFLVSLGLVINYLATGHGYQVAAASVALKTLVLYAIMVTGSIWEKRVFGKYLFAPAFFWEDVVSMLVIGLHTAYLAMMLGDWGSADNRMLLALAAYASYAINATQFLMKLRAARLESPAQTYAQGGAR